MNPLHLPQSALVLFSIFGLVFGFILGLWVFLDANSRGTPRIVSSIWFVAILFFPFVVTLYALMRIVELLPRVSAGPPPDAQQPGVCPYCRTTVPQGQRICPSCGRLL